jgi:hypothetical protein
MPACTLSGDLGDKARVRPDLWPLVRLCHHGSDLQRCAITYSAQPARNVTVTY